MLTLFITIVLLGVLVGLLHLIPMDADFKQLIKIVAIIAAVLLVVDFFFGLGLASHFGLKFR